LIKSSYDNNKNTSNDIDGAMINAGDHENTYKSLKQKEKLINHINYRKKFMYRKLT
jgi:hypothetical protein